MKYSIDVNLFLYATDSDSPFHQQAQKFFEKRQTETGECCLVWDTVYSFLRIATHPSLFVNPLAPKMAMKVISNACELLDATFLSVDETSWKIFTEMNQSFTIRGKLVPDAVLASVLEAHGVSKFYTHDRDFWKFPYLKPIDPV